MLFLSHTPVSVPALTGAIMCMGVATANSVLVVSFARERMNAGDDAAHAAVQAGGTRFRPGLMTDRKSTPLNSRHPVISYAVFCLKKKKKTSRTPHNHRREKSEV